MKIETTELEDRQAEVIVEIDAKLADGEKRKAARRLAKRIRIPGFRPGKAPYQVIVRRVGDAALLEEALESIIDTVYPKMLEEAELDPIDSGEVVKIDTDPLKVTFRVPLRPTVDLGDYLDLRVDYDAPEVSDEQLEHQLEHMRDEKVILEEVERPVEIGDQIIADIEIIDLAKEAETEDKDEDEDSSGSSESDDSEPDQTSGEAPSDDNENEESEETDEEGEDEDDEDEDEEDDEYEYGYEEDDDEAELIYEEDSKLIITEDMDWPAPNFADHATGMETEETREFEVEYPADYADSRLAGRTARVTITCSKIHDRTIPEWSDDFAQTLGDYESLLDLRVKVRQEMLEAVTGQADHEYAHKVLDQLVETASFIYPPVMLNREIDNMVNETENRISSQFGMSLETYLKMTNTTPEQFRENFKENGVQRLKRGLVLSELIAKLDLDVTDAHIDAKITEITRPFPAEFKDQMAELYSQDAMRTSVKFSILEDWAHQYIATIAKGEDPDAKLAELTAAPKDEIAESEAGEPVAESEDDTETGEQPEENESVETAEDAADETSDTNDSEGEQPDSDEEDQAEANGEDE